ncbi:MAG: FAD:protein FMN transferase [Gracilibacteraceae bacterium]|nr:FAD:protein FMN transferase [Gracilibacteraceae bacterium]
MDRTNWRKITFFCFDTVNTITVWSGSEAALAQAREMCFYYQSIFSRFAPGSDIWRLNHSRGEAMRVAPETVEIISMSVAYSALTAGAFDITMGALCEMWGFGRSPAVPRSELLIEALGKTGSGGIRVEGNTVRCAAGAILDLGGIAKGYAADKIADMLTAAGAVCGIINCGGDVLTFGAKPDGSPWRVGLQDPGQPRGRYSRIAVTRGRKAVATSGVYERRFTDRSGQSFHHILDPRTGRPAAKGLVAASVIHPCGALAEALATACICLGAAEAQKLIAGQDAAAYLISADGSCLKTGNML